MTTDSLPSVNHKKKNNYVMKIIDYDEMNDLIFKTPMR